MLFEPYLSPNMDGFGEIPPSGKLLYVLAQIRPAGSLSDLAKCAGIGERNAFQLTRLLKKYKWMKMERRGNKSIPIPIIPQFEDQRRTELLQKCYEVSQYKGEFLLQAFHDVAIVTEGSVYNARPEFLKHPVTEEKLELDIFFPETQDAWELQGFQHFGPSKIQPLKDKAKEQQANDLIKLGRSMMNGVHVEVLTYRDLSLDGVLKRTPQHLPRRPIDRSSLYVRTLEKLAASYRRWAARTEAELRTKQAKEDAASTVAPAMG